MRVEVPQSRLVAALSRARAVADTRSRVETLQAVLVKAERSKVSFISTDMQVWLIETFDAKVSKPGATASGVAHLHNVARTLQSGLVSLRGGWKDDGLEMHTENARWKLKGLPAADFPEVPSCTSDFVVVDAAVLSLLVRQAFPTVSPDESRPNLNGALIHVLRTGTIVVSTDGHRLTRSSATLSLPEGWKAIVPRKGLKELGQMLEVTDGECQVGIQGGHLFARRGGLELVIRLADVTFPPWKQVVPQSHLSALRIAREDLLAALRQVAVVAPSKVGTVRATVKPNALKLSADNPELGAVTAEVACKWTGTGTLEMGLNDYYLLDALDTITTDEVIIEFGSELDPAVLKPVDGPDVLVVIMPIRI